MQIESILNDNDFPVHINLINLNISNNTIGNMYPLIDIGAIIYEKFQFVLKNSFLS